MKLFSLHFQGKQLKFHFTEVMSALDEWSMQYTLDQFYRVVQNVLLSIVESYCKVISVSPSKKQLQMEMNQILLQSLELIESIWQWVEAAYIHIDWLLICVAFRITRFNYTSKFAYTCHSAVCIVSTPFASVSSISAHFKKRKVHSGTCWREHFKRLSEIVENAWILQLLHTVW